MDPRRGSAGRVSGKVEPQQWLAGRRVQDTGKIGPPPRLHALTYPRKKASAIRCRTATYYGPRRGRPWTRSPLPFTESLQACNRMLRNMWVRKTYVFISSYLRSRRGILRTNKAIVFAWVLLLVGFATGCCTGNAQ